MTPEENIEYYLGKDKFKNLFFSGKELLSAYFPINDNLRDYAQEKSKRVELIENFGLSNQKMHYTNLNNLGFRSEFDYVKEDLVKYEKLVLCLGCSDVLAPNVADENMWTTLVQKELDLKSPGLYKVLNLGIYSGSPDTVSRLMVNYIKCLPNVSDVCVIWPNTNRREFVSRQKSIAISGQTSYTDLPYENYWNLSDWVSDSYNFHKNKILCESFTKANNVNFHDVLVNRFDKKVQIDYSSAFFALGPRSHLAISKYFKKKILGEASMFESKKK